MAEIFVIKGKKELSGEVEIEGSKNAAGPIIAACLLSEEEIILDNIPLISDIINLISILKGIGAEIEWIGKKKIKVKAGKEINPEKINFEKAAKSRVSVLLIGALLPRFKEFKIAKPGGDRIGLRPIVTHLEAFKKMGVQIEESNDFYYFKRETLFGREIILPEFSVTATENLMMAASLAKGKTIIKTAAQEPHVSDLAVFLNKIGARIKGIGTHTLTIEGVDKLRGGEHKIIPDIIDAGTFIITGALASKKLLVKNVIPSQLGLFLEKIKEAGVVFEKREQEIEVYGNGDFKAVKIQALPYPGFPTDLLPLVVPLLTQAKGKSLIHDPLYENRLSYTQELRRMGADIEIVDPHRAFVFGPTPLMGSSIKSWDIRAGASLVIAALVAQGKTVIENIEQIDRGYEKMEERLQKLGADIKRVKV